MEYDVLLKDAGRLIVEYKLGSTSLIQRKLKLSYTRSCSIMEQLEKLEVVGKFEGNKPRVVRFNNVESLNEYFKTIKKLK